MDRESNRSTKEINEGDLSYPLASSPKSTVPGLGWSHSSQVETQSCTGGKNQSLEQSLLPTGLL